MKKRFLGILMTLVMLIGLLPVTAFAADCENHAEACIEAVQELVDTLPDMTEIDEDNREEVIATLEAIDEAKLHLTDAEREEIDWTKYSDAAFVLWPSDGCPWRNGMPAILHLTHRNWKGVSATADLTYQAQRILLHLCLCFRRLTRMINTISCRFSGCRKIHFRCEFVVTMCRMMCGNGRAIC